MLVETVFVHGAFAESSSWNGVLTKLITKGYPTDAVAKLIDRAATAQ
jgi:hypothetical protein